MAENLVSGVADVDVLQAALLGLVEGATEYLPVSSTGHLIVAQRLMGIEGGEAADAYAICIQAGAILAVLLLYRGRVRQVLAGLMCRDPEGRSLAMNLCLAFLPAALAGLALEKWVKGLLFNLPSIAVAWVVGGLAILAFDARAVGRSSGRPITALGWRGALAIGAFQVLALWPGTSRSLVTILGGISVGLSLPAAVEFSFLLGLLTLGAATAKDAVTGGQAMLDAYGAGTIAVGFVVATLSALVAVRWMVGWLQSHGLGVFGWYRVVAGATLGLALLFFGCGGNSAGGAVLDPGLLEALPSDDAAAAGPVASCIHAGPSGVQACASFRDLDGQGGESMRYAEALCRSNGGSWEAGECPSVGATGRCEQPGRPPHFAQTDWCYGDESVCRSTCLGTFTDL